MVSFNLSAIIVAALAAGAIANPLPAPDSSIAERDATPGNTCDFKYKGVYDDYVLKGKNLDMSKFGEWGQGFLSGLRDECGTVSSWTFDKGDFDGYQWQAKFKLPLGVFGCVGKVATDHGMATHDKCHGKYES